MAEQIAYFDYAAATPLSGVAFAAMQPYFSERFFNPSSPYAPAVFVRRDIDVAKAEIAKILGAKPNDIIMTAGATESINLAMTLGRRGHIITPDIEHAAVLESAQNYENTQIATQNNGLVDLDLLEKSVHDDTILLSVAAANNETGTVQSLAAIAEIVKKVRLQRQVVGNPQPLYLHSDASQAAGLLDLHVSRLGVDLLTLNSGKVYGPKQVGLLWKSSEINLEPLIFGGGQEMGLRSGTENVAGVIGFAAALQDAEKKRSSETKRLAALRDTLQKTLLTKFPNAEIIGSQKKRLPNFLTIAFPGLDAERVLFLLENKGVFVATGSACAANKATRSHVLTALGLPEKTIDGSLRFTLGRQTTEETLDFALPKIITAINSEYARQQK